MKNIKIIFSYIKGKWSQVFVFASCNLLSVFFSMLSLGMLVPFLNMLFGKDELVTVKPVFAYNKEALLNSFKYFLSNIIIHHDKMWALFFLIVTVLVSIILKNTFYFISRYTLHPLRNEIIRNLRENVFSKMLSLPIGFFTNKRKGDIIARMTNDVREVEESIIAVMDLLFSTPITIIFYLIFMLSLSVKLCLFLFVLLPVAGLIIGRVTKSLKKHSTNNSERIGNLLSIMDESITGLRIIKAFVAEKVQFLKFTHENNTLNTINNKIAFKREMASPLSETMGIAVLCIILWFGGSLVLGSNKEIEAGTFIMFILVFTQLLDPLKKLSQIFYNIQKGTASLERINMILLAENPIKEIENATIIKEFTQQIEFKNVDFYYGENKILHNINLVIPKGKTVALVGSSGSGKSTLVDLIPRFHDVSNGEILLDGKNLKAYNIHSIRNLIGMVSQEPILFNDTIANNIALAHQDIAVEKITEAAQIANAHNFILQKPETYQTGIGDRGNKLSGGEKQRITIARAVLKNPPILILDEATSSLDTTSEKIVQDAIDNLMANRTCIVIAHRLSTVQNANEIIVLDKGEIVERGTHQQLIALNGAYRKLVDMQQVK